MASILSLGEEITTEGAVTFLLLLLLLFMFKFMFMLLLFVSTLVYVPDSKFPTTGKSPTWMLIVVGGI